MRRRAIACLLSALTFTLAGCDISESSGQAKTGATAQTIAWNGKAAGQLRQAIANRATHGLDRMDFAVEGKPGTPAGDDALTANALRYARALAMGAFDPAKLHEIYTLPRPKPDLRQGLAQALNKGKLGEWFENLAPASDTYRELSKAYLTLRAEGETAPPPLPALTAPIRPGETNARIPAFARRLAEAGYLDRADASGNRYNPAMVQAVKRLQADYGIDPDGEIGADTAEIMGLSDADRASALAVAMERMRWLDRTPPPTRIDVNLASARLDYWRDGKIADSRKVVTGKPDTATPQLGSPIYRLVANPTWTVPRSIQHKELAGKGAAYLRRNNMIWKDGWIVQQPGPKNSLGLVKFDMQNEHAIYLHDTPAKQLFDEVQRQRSHGCVRVEDALGFAEMLARDEGILDEWHKARATGKESFVSLPRPIPVRLYYQTVLFDADGAPVVRADPYGWNDRVSAALGFPARKTAQLRSSTAEVGP